MMFQRSALIDRRNSNSNGKNVLQKKPSVQKYEIKLIVCYCNGLIITRFCFEYKHTIIKIGNVRNRGKLLVRLAE